MKLTVVGFGQCGGRVADEFSRVSNKALARRGIEITSGIYAVNTDSADLSGLRYIKSDWKHRILIGGRSTNGHGVGKINEIGAMVAKDDSDKVFNAIMSTRRLFETDAFLLVASGAGGTGSGAISVMTKMIKERFDHKPMYALVILPFEHEEVTEERSTYNTALCLKSINSVADAVIVFDNQRHVRKDVSLTNNYEEINRTIVAPFYDLLCAGEEKKRKFIGSKTLDAGDIKQTITGWTAIGFGRADVPAFNFPFRRSGFRAKMNQTYQGIHAMDEAINQLSVACNPADASRALYLVSGPASEMNMYLIKEIGIYLRSIATRATIRNGDYPREKNTISVNVILSGLGHLDKIRQYYAKSVNLIPEFQKRREDRENRLRDLEDVGKNIPSLLG
jgi:tubulin-like protein CetZ